MSIKIVYYFQINLPNAYYTSLKWLTVAMPLLEISKRLEKERQERNKRRLDTRERD